MYIPIIIKKNFIEVPKLRLQEMSGFEVFQI